VRQGAKRERRDGYYAASVPRRRWTELRRQLTIDTSPLRGSHDLRHLVLGNTITTLGSQATLVALPYQLYVQTRSPALTGLLGVFELAPLIVLSLYGGGLADRVDRRKLLFAVQFLIALLTFGLAATASLDSPPLAALYVLGALLAGANGMQNVTRGAIIPNVVPPEQLRAALALVYGLTQAMMVVGPAVGGFLIAAGGVRTAYLVDAASALLMIGTVVGLTAQLPRGESAEEQGIWASVAEGLRFVRSQKALVGSFAIDLSAMAFGMPRTLFPVLALTVYHAGATGTGLLNAAVSAGAVVAALTTGWLPHVRRLGLIVIAAVIAWGAAITFAGLVPSLGLAMVMLAIAGAADSVSAVCRSAINQTVTPDHMRGRMSSVFSLVVQSGPRLGDVRSGAVASLGSTQFAVASGGIACVAAAVAIAFAFPSLASYDANVAEAEFAAAEAGAGAGAGDPVGEAVAQSA
jgi:MFS family permease